MGVEEKKVKKKFEHSNWTDLNWISREKTGYCRIKDSVKYVIYIYILLYPLTSCVGIWRRGLKPNVINKFKRNLIPMSQNFLLHIIQR